VLGADDRALGEELAVLVGDPDGDREGYTLGEELGKNDGEALGLADGSLHIPQLARQE
jgi:hypothetical protein